jgi:glucose/arabinose dehydrogenase
MGYNTAMRTRLGFWMAGLLLAGSVQAQSLVDSNLTYDTVVSSGLSFPIAIAFLNPSDPNRFFVIEKNSGRVKLVQNGAVVSTVLDLPVNNASERGLLGIALHPDFATNGYVYLYYTRSSTSSDTSIFDRRGWTTAWSATAGTAPRWWSRR